MDRKHGGDVLTANQVAADAIGRAKSPGQAASLFGFAVQAFDGPIGRVRDILLDQDSGQVCHVMVDTLPWWPGTVVPVHSRYVERIDWRNRRLEVGLTRAQVRHGS